MSAVEEDAPSFAVTKRPSGRWRRLRAIFFTALVAQYTLIALGVGLPLAATLRYFVTPQIVATFEALTKALNH
jgi:hypothetical protein